LHHIYKHNYILPFFLFQVLLDLIGELLKFNEISMALLDHAVGLPGLNSVSSSSSSFDSESDSALCDHPAYAKLMKLGTIMLNNIVNSAVLVSSMELTLGNIRSSIRPMQRIRSLNHHESGDESGGGGGSGGGMVNWVKQEEVEKFLAVSARRPTTGYGKKRRPFATHNSFDPTKDDETFPTFDTVLDAIPPAPPSPQSSRETYASMRASNLREEVRDRGIDLKWLLEKQDLIDALLKNDEEFRQHCTNASRAPPTTTTQDVSSSDGGDNDTIPSYSSSSLSPISSSSSSSWFDAMLTKAALVGVREGSIMSFWRMLRSAVFVALLKAVSGRTNDVKHSTDICVINAICVLLSEAHESGENALSELVSSIHHDYNIDHIGKEDKEHEVGHDGSRWSDLGAEDLANLPSSSSQQNGSSKPLLLSKLSATADNSTAAESVVPSGGGGGGGGGGGKAGSSSKVIPVSFKQGLTRALIHWSRHYEYQVYERKFIEFQSGIPFYKWKIMVSYILKEFAPLLPSSLN
jgi:hypothetical protein